MRRRSESGELHVPEVGALSVMAATYIYDDFLAIYGCKYNLMFG
jgi:hypothetical protein